MNSWWTCAISARGTKLSPSVQVLFLGTLTYFSCYWSFLIRHMPKSHPCDSWCWGCDPCTWVTLASVVVWQPLLQPLKQQHSVQQCIECPQWREVVWWWPHGIRTQQLQLPAGHLCWQWHRYHLLRPQPRQHGLPGGCHFVASFGAGQREGGTPVAQLQRSALPGRSDLRHWGPRHGQESRVLSELGHPQQEPGRLKSSDQGEQHLQHKWCCLTHQVSALQVCLPSEVSTSPTLVCADVLRGTGVCVQLFINTVFLYTVIFYAIYFSAK